MLSNTEQHLIEALKVFLRSLSDSEYTQLQENVKEARADLKRAGEKLEKAHPESESIKFGFTIAIMPA